jgi:peroxin-6
VAYYFDHYATDGDTQVLVTEEDFIKARQELVPSVSLDELRHYESVRATFEGSKDGEGNANAVQHSKRPTSPQTRQSVPRGDIYKLLKRASSQRDGMPSTNGNKLPVQSPGAGQAVGDASDVDDDYVIRTDKLSLNGSAAVKAPSGKGKGKGKDVAAVDGPVQSLSATANADGEDLYD